MGKQWKQWKTLFSWAPKSLQLVTAAMKFKKKKKSLLFERTSLTNVDGILTSRDITLPTKVCIVKIMFFPLVMYGCELDHKEGWMMNSDAFELWYWRRLLRVPWTARRWSQLILKEINPEYSLVGLMLKLKFQYFGHLIRRAHSLKKTLMLGKIEGKRRTGWQRWDA